MAQHTDTPRSGHPIEKFLCSVLDDLRALADAPTWSMDAATTTRVVALGARVAAGVAEIEARSITQAQVLDLPGAAQCRDTVRWLQLSTGVTRRTIRLAPRRSCSRRPLVGVTQTISPGWAARSGNASTRKAPTSAKPGLWRPRKNALVDRPACRWVTTATA
jgi:hypothetical protein